MASSSEQKPGLVQGTWFVDESCAVGLLLNKMLPSEIEQGPRFIGWGGFRLEFQEGGKLIDSYSAECGLDPNRHIWSGRWSVDADQSILSMRIENVEFSGPMRDQPSLPSEDYKNGRQYRIIELTDHVMLLERVHAS